MITFFHCLHSDLLKIKRHPILWIHLLIPVVGIVIFLLSDVFNSSPSSTSAASGIVGAMAVVFPTLIGVVCSMITDQEEQAGNFQGILAHSSRIIPFVSILSVLLMLGLGAVLLTVFGFDIGFALILHQTPFGFKFYILAALVLFGSNLFMYLLHLFLSLRVSQGVSIVVGIVESLLSALLITDLGEGIWVMIPSAWGLRFFRIFQTHTMGGTIVKTDGLRNGLILCLTGTFLICLLSLIWFLHWEGKKSEE